MKEGDYPQHYSGDARVWKGRYNDAVVALKVIRRSRRSPPESVSMSCDP